MEWKKGNGRARVQERRAFQRLIELSQPAGEAMTREELKTAARSSTAALEAYFPIPEERKKR